VRAKGKRQKLRAKDKGEGNDQSNSPLTLAALHPLPWGEGKIRGTPLSLYRSPTIPLSLYRSPTTSLSLYRSPTTSLSLWERVRVRAMGEG